MWNTQHLNENGGDFNKKCIVCFVEFVLPRWEILISVILTSYSKNKLHPILYNYIYIILVFF